MIYKVLLRQNNYYNAPPPSRRAPREPIDDALSPGYDFPQVFFSETSFQGGVFQFSVFVYVGSSRQCSRYPPLGKPCQKGLQEPFSTPMAVSGSMAMRLTIPQRFSPAM